MINNIYTNTHILNRKEYQKCKKELINYNYLPVLLRQVYGTEYYETLTSNTYEKEILDKIHKTSTYNRMEIINEFIDWCGENNYNQLINKDAENQLNDSLKELKKEFKYLNTVL